jgi:hypothetical protein
MMVVMTISPQKSRATSESRGRFRVSQQNAKRLRAALDDRDPSEVDLVLNDYFAAGLSDDFSPLLIELAEATWHRRHEDVVSIIQDLRSGGAEQALERLAQTRFAYLAYDDGHALARKCTWALADIGTDTARDALDRLSLVPDQIVAGYAQKRLHQWEIEGDRKGGSQGPS